jgi:VWFA-related protein
VQPADEADVVRITTNLIQIDAVVTDRKGKVVTNLRPQDFEILVNGKSQNITTFSRVSVVPQPTNLPEARKSTGISSPPVPPVRLRPGQVQRTIALVIDDLTLSVESMNSVKKALKKFVDDQMQPGDLVAIIRTGSGIGTLQQFTSDRQQLYAAIARTRYNWLVGRMSAFAPIGGAGMASGGDPSPGDRGIQPSGDVEKLRDDILARDALGAIDYIVKGMRTLPGRKAVLLLSEGFTLASSTEPDLAQIVREKVRRIVDDANRAGVVVYTMDARGLQTLGLNANDDVNKPLTASNVLGRTTMTGEEIRGALNGRRLQLLSTQEGLSFLAEQTGGFAIHDTNDLSGGIRKTLDDQNDYYLLGFQPDATTFEQGYSRFNQLAVKVKGSGFRVRYRSGFYGVKDEVGKTGAVTPQQRVAQALVSPFAAPDIDLRLTPLFGNDAKSGSFVRTLVHIPAKELTFANKPDGSREAVINIVAYTFGDNGTVVDSAGETHTVTLTEKLYERALTTGLVYSLNVPIKRAGAYQLRVAVRDDKSDKVGSASQFIDIPDLTQDRLALSGIALSSYDATEVKNRANDSSRKPTEETTGETALTQAALRRFQADRVLEFAYVVYHAKPNSDLGVQLTTRVELYREGKRVFANMDTPYDPKGQPDPTRLVVEGGLKLAGLPEGEYVLQIVVVDAFAKEKYRTARNWVDFEIVK